VTEIQVTGRAGVPNDATAASINFTAVNAREDGYITAYPCGTTVPTASILNYAPGDTVANSTIIGIGTSGKICISNTGTTDLLADITGWYPANSDFTPLTPQRLLDTRTTSGTTVTGPARFVETFDGNTGRDRFELWTYNRDKDKLNASYSVGGDWYGDHDFDCGPPTTQRHLNFTAGSDAIADQPNRNNQTVYVCRDHLMTSMAGASGFDIVAFSPKDEFADVHSVSFDVNLTDLGNRQWWKVGVLSTDLWRDDAIQYGESWTCDDYKIGPSLPDYGCGWAPGWIVTDTHGSEVGSSLATDKLLVATWGGGASAGQYCQKIGDTLTGGCVNPTPNDKATRHPVSLTDNGNGTVTFTVAGVATTTAGSFPDCPCRVVFYDNSYTPDKDTGIIGHTWHWDNIVVR
jgi:hypothetical protein